jgi:hypothetical protein
VTSPDGREWEIYAFKFSWRKPDRRRAVLTSLVAAIRAVRSDAWTVEAITLLPAPLTYTWTTVTEHKGQVLAQVEGHLARGDIATRLANGVYCGESRSAR